MKKWEKIFIVAIGTIAAAYIGIDSWHRNYNKYINEKGRLYGPPPGYSVAIREFNAQFTAYEGANNSAAQIRSLIATIDASNALKRVDSEEDEGFVKYTGPKSFSTNKQYKVELKYNNEGLVCEVIVTENGNIDKKDNVKRSK